MSLCLGRGPWAPLVHSSLCLKLSSSPGPVRAAVFLEVIRCQQLQLLRLCPWPAWTIFPKASQMRPTLAPRPTTNLNSSGLPALPLHASLPTRKGCVFKEQLLRRHLTEQAFNAFFIFKKKKQIKT
uniref:Uncharacterized protein n=1 Tax=Micrurus lemniscatus lemniscatus TaxID=129467 RepID=A0A2D4IN07_MICLE